MTTDHNNTAAIRALYVELITTWNHRQAQAFAKLFAVDGNLVGFDGSQLNSQAEIATSLGQIFADHVTAPYVSHIQDVRLITAETAIVRAVAGMIPPGQTALDPALHSIQTLVAVKQSTGWQIACFQNTPAQFHGRPDAVAALTAELEQALAQAPFSAAN